MVVSVGNFQTVQPERDEEDRHVDEILENLEHLTGLTEHVEFRAITPGRAIGGLFNNMRDLACYSVAADDEWQVYIGVNPRDIPESVLKNDIYPGKTPEGVTVSRRKYLLVDVDPVRPGKCCASEQEKSSALQVFRKLIDWLCNTEIWPRPIEIDSGNGYHALFRININSDDGCLIRSCLEALAARFDTPKAKVDTVTHDAKRLIRIPGTTNRKGTSTPERPHRRSKLLSAGDQAIVTRQQLEALAKEAGWKAPSQKRVTTTIPIMSPNTRPVFQMVMANNSELPAPERETTSDQANDDKGRADSKSTVSPDTTKKAIRDALQWMEKQPPAIEGQGGDRTTYNVAKGIVQRFGLSSDEAMSVLEVYSSRCSPPWSKRELEHKVREAAKAKSSGKDGSEENSFEQQKSLVWSLIETNCELWKNRKGEPFATVTTGNCHPNFEVKSERFKEWIEREYYNTYGKFPYDSAVEPAVKQAEKHGRHFGKIYTTHVRVAYVDDRVCLDLGDSDWTTIEISATGWKRATQPLVKFIRPTGMTALPVPVQGGQIDRLNQFLNLSPQNFVLLIGFLVMALRGKGPFPILLLTGRQGSGKSTLSKMIRELIDPNEATLRFTPKDARDFAIEAASNYLPIFDNISHIPDWMSDFLCGISTGGAFALRRLYTDRDQEIFQFSNPVVLNSIVEIARRSDLLDRCLLVDLDTISKRRDEEQLWNDFRQAQPEILGALLNAVVTGLENWPSIQLTDPPRMADFARWITAAETGLGWSSGTFMKAYRENIDIGTSTALEQSSLTQALREIMTCRKTWKGPATELLNDLRESADWPGGREPMDWPRSPSALGNKLRRLAPSLELEGIKISTERENGGNRNRYILVEKVDPVVQSSLNHQDES